eukprot:TRINITY_DN2178_c0_g1_i1.p1 TRINITY_DN2178_c0_g1~~TRINITY_DN2178_c0_g1_i1.p1  ORF type:complete len:648 (-),score=81.24 TRINITY_DN2178_c0_g1_i1:297-2240(-)
MKVTLFWFSLCISTILSHKCIHDDIVDHDLKHGIRPALVQQEYEETSKRNLQDLNLFTQPLRIKVNLDNLLDDPYTCYKAGDPRVMYRSNNKNMTCRQQDILTPDKRAVLEGLLKNAVEYFNSVLKVRPLKGNLKLISSAIHAQKICDDIRIPPSWDSTGVPDAEYVLFVTSRPSESDLTLASAKYCQAEIMNSVEGRPIAGIVNFAPYSMDLTDEGYSKQIGIIKHEITHALGFTRQKWENTGFIKWTSDTQYEVIRPNQIIKEYDHPEIGHVVKRIITPNVAEAVRKHFNCSGLDGAELEDGGGSGTAGSHWEQRVFRNEYMTGTSTPFPVYSLITFSLMKDMGFYDFSIENATKLEPLVWGRNMGCPFVNGSCKKWPLTTEAEGYRCETSSPKGQCRFDYKGWAECNINEPDPLDDGCTFYRSTIRTGCEVDTKFFQLTLNAGESHGDSSRCFHSSLAKFPGVLSSYMRVPQANVMQCYKTRCAGPKILKVGIEDVWYDCPYEGGNIYAIDFGGELNCRPKAADVICADAKEDPDWPKVARVSPRRAKPGDYVTIYGTNLNITNGTIVKIFDLATDVELVSSTEIKVKLPSNDKFNSVRAMGIFSRRHPVIVIDEAGRTSHIKDAILIEINLNGDDVASFFEYV